MALSYTDWRAERPPQSAPEAVRGVALVILKNKLFQFNRSRILVVREKTSKIATGRKRGECGILCETVEKGWGESPGKAALRCIHQELGYPYEEIPRDFYADPDSFFMGGGITNGVSGRGYRVHYRGSDIGAYMNNADGEVVIEGWLTPSELRRKKKLGQATELALKVHSLTEEIARGKSLVPLTAELLDSVDRT